MLQWLPGEFLHFILVVKRTEVTSFALSGIKALQEPIKELLMKSKSLSGAVSLSDPVPFTTEGCSVSEHFGRHLQGVSAPYPCSERKGICCLSAEGEHGQKGCSISSEGKLGVNIK